MTSSTCIPSAKVIVMSRGSLANDVMSNQDHKRKESRERPSLFHVCPAGIARETECGSELDGLGFPWAEDVLANGKVEE